MNEIFAKLEAAIKKIFDMIANIFKIFEENGEEAEEGATE